LVTHSEKGRSLLIVFSHISMTVLWMERKDEKRKEERCPASQSRPRR
jgi:hypothetical protein